MALQVIFVVKTWIVKIVFPTSFSWTPHKRLVFRRVLGFIFWISNKVNSLLTFIRRLLTLENPTEKFEQLSQTLTKVFQLAPSNKHMNHRELGKLEPSESLKYKREMAYA